MKKIMVAILEELVAPATSRIENKATRNHGWILIGYKGIDSLRGHFAWCQLVPDIAVVICQSIFFFGSNPTGILSGATHIYTSLRQNGKAALAELKSLAAFLTPRRKWRRRRWELELLPASSCSAGNNPSAHMVGTALRSDSDSNKLVCTRRKW